MRLSDIIFELQAAKNRYGDLPVYNFGGSIQVIRLYPGRDGELHSGEKPNDISMEILNGR